MAARRGCGHVTAALVSAAIVLSACTSPPPHRRIRPTRAPTTTTIDELRDAVAAWHRTPATITYRSERQRPGLPESVHQCLRAVVSERSGIQEGLSMCDPSGVVTLVWDPPTRWRLDVSEAGRTTTSLVVGHDGFVCERPDGGSRSCRSRKVDAILGDLAFRELIAGVNRTMRGVGLSPGGQVTVTEGVVAGIPVRCYERRSEGSRARWCFADDGALLSLELMTEGRAPTALLAAHVSGDVDHERLDPPTP